MSMEREQADEIIDELKLSNSNLLDVETAIENLTKVVERLFRRPVQKLDLTEVKKKLKEEKIPIRRRKKFVE